jgi:molybdopterin-containing oxidoreductase family iron-sulfur binding subunit
MDETADKADLVFPTLMPLESWDAYESKQGMVATLQPTAGRINAAPQIGDVFLKLLPPDLKWGSDYQQFMMQQLSERQLFSSREQWLHMVQNGGRFVADKPTTRPGLNLGRETVVTLEKHLQASLKDLSEGATLQVVSSLRFYDGRSSNRPWLPEIPEAVSMVAWQTVALVPPPKMEENKWRDGDIIKLESDHGQVEVPVFGYSGLHPDALVIQLGQGHTRYGRYATDQGINPLVLLPRDPEVSAGVPDYSAPLKSMTAGGRHLRLAQTSGSRNQHGRKIALSTTLKEMQQAAPIVQGLTMHDFPFTPPLPEGYSHQRDIYPAHEHADYRWGMVVDLDRCVGCSACVAACYAENNIGVVGEARIVEGREMSWLRIERYRDQKQAERSIFLPMLCQHCDNAPCESVCPVYAPHHSKEGLNNQVYNRCIGTRFCAQNCPYKVRRFNWFDWQWPKPLNMQLNPNVTVRSKGVMEKCSFCIQRIKEAHDVAKNEKRAIRDGEVIPACVQTCPTDALLFGNLMDSQSAVRRLIQDRRAYQVMGYLNTKPAVIYLKKVL